MFSLIKFIVVTPLYNIFSCIVNQNSKFQLRSLFWNYNNCFFWLRIFYWQNLGKQILRIDRKSFLTDSLKCIKCFPRDSIQPVIRIYYWNGEYGAFIIRLIKVVFLTIIFHNFYSRAILIRPDRFDLRIFEVNLLSCFETFCCCGCCFEFASLVYNNTSFWWWRVYYFPIALNREGEGFQGQSQIFSGTLRDRKCGFDVKVASFILLNCILNFLRICCIESRISPCREANDAWVWSLTNIFR